jgi:tRNA A37 threonylcarbamoyladenosine biosynthesis protein TsaE
MFAGEKVVAPTVIEQPTIIEPSTGTETYSGKITSLKPNQIFVFGSNEGGSQGQAPTHGAGAAKLAKDKFGAIQGQSRGLQGQSYAIVTKKFYDVERSSTPEEITTEIKTLYDYARNNPDKEFLVSDYSETNLNGYSGQEMAAMFANAGPIPSNIVFNENFEKLVSTGIEPVVEEVAAVEEVTPGTQKPKFTYKGTTIDTDFQLTEGQRQALERLIDFSTDPGSEFITLQGAAGTGKTSIIGYLQKYLRNYKFNFLAPTHAATAELAFATVKTGNKQLPMTVASAISTKYDPTTGESTPVINAKLARRLGLSNNIIVLDEVSMLNSKDYEALVQVAPKNNIKVIFMGDVMQIPEVDVRNPEKKLVSKAFTDTGQVVLTEVKRTSSDAILNMLTNVRNNVNDQIPIVPSTDQLEYLPISKFNSKLAEVFEKNPEETVLISYTNKGVQDYNLKIRESLGRYGDLQKGDIVVGYLGYSSKQIEKQNIANSIRYTIRDVRKDGSLYSIVASSKKLKSLQDAGVSDVEEIASTNYAQLSRNDSFDFENLTEEDFQKNNEMLSKMMSKLHEAKQIALRTKSGKDWAKYYDVKDGISMQLRIVDLGDTYIYNPASGVMEKYVNEQHKNIDKDLLIEKGIDFGHAVTIHKSQGSTVKNVFFDASSLPRGSSSKLMMNGKEVSTEKHSLLYVGISRASEYLGINADNPLNFYYPDGQEAAATPAPVEQKSRIIKVNQFSITIQPDGKMFYDNGKEVTDQTTKNKVSIRKELQDGTLRVSTYNNSEYFVLLDGRILGSGKTNLGKETVGDPKIKEQILDKAVLYRKTC